ncbi:MAG: cation-transporting P-type ATPase [Spirosomataceae bacterium]
MLPTNPYPFHGLSDTEVENSRTKNGANTSEDFANNAWWEALKDTVAEPMFILLVACTVIYFSLNELSEGFFMLGAILLVSAISFYQDSRSKKALASLKAYTKASAVVIRNNAVVEIASEALVLGDLVVASEGELIPTDGKLLQINDFSVNESILTGETFAVFKDIDSSENNQVFQGTLVQSGQGIFETTAIGKQTRLGKIGTSMAHIETEKTPLQRQIDSFVKKWLP